MLMGKSKSFNGNGNSGKGVAHSVSSFFHGV